MYRLSMQFCQIHSAKGQNHLVWLKNEVHTFISALTLSRISTKIRVIWLRTVVLDGKVNLIFRYSKTCWSPGDSPVVNGRSSSVTQATNTLRKPFCVGTCSGFSLPSFKKSAMSFTLAAGIPTVPLSVTAFAASDSALGCFLRIWVELHSCREGVLDSPHQMILFLQYVEQLHN